MLETDVGRAMATLAVMTGADLTGGIQRNLAGATIEGLLAEILLELRRNG